MKLSELESHDEISAQRRAVDREFAAELESHRLGDQVSVAVLAYRARRNLTQAQLALQLGYRQPQIARLERGDVTPTVDTLQRLARAGVLEVHVRRDGTEVVVGEAAENAAYARETAAEAGRR